MGQEAVCFTEESPRIARREELFVHSLDCVEGVLHLEDDLSQVGLLNTCRHASTHVFRPEGNMAQPA